MNDATNLCRFQDMHVNAPEAMTALVAFDTAALAAGAIPAKYKQMMAIAVALMAECPYCVKIHSTRARDAGATNHEIAEVVLVAAALRAGAAMTHGSHAAAKSEAFCPVAAD